MDRDTIIEVTQKLTGRCYPYGDTNIDKERYESLLLKIAVASSLIDEVYEAGKLYNRHEYSIQNISNKANRYLTELRDMLCEIDYLPPREPIAGSEDCISREEAIEAVEKQYFGGTVADINPSWRKLHNILESLPPVTPTIDIVRCGECENVGTEDCPIDDEVYRDDFCCWGIRKKQLQRSEDV